jgi:hypothetical protein
MMPPEPIKTVYFTNLSYQHVWLSVYPPLPHSNKQLSEASFCMRFVSYQMKVGNLFLSELLV